jgi:sigma-B regulation protein RsbU (phosphoserine phosphatase)
LERGCVEDQPQRASYGGFNHRVSFAAGLRHSRGPSKEIRLSDSQPIANAAADVPPAPLEADPLKQLRQELRTPINEIIERSEILQEDAQSSGQEKSLADLQKIQNAARRLLGLINTRFLGQGSGQALLSRLAPPVQTRTAPPVSPARADPGIPLHGRILTVDDADNNRDMLWRRLQRLGLSVQTAATGQQVLEIVRAQPFDLVLLDIMMPGLDGLSVLQALKADGRTRHIPVIMISALDEMESVVRCIEAGAEDYLSKPFDSTLLRARIGACLEKKSLRDAEQRHLRVIEETQRRLSEELGQAAHYVRSILPPPCAKPLAIDWQYLPSTELGGDAFGYHWVDPDHFAVYLLDVCGHGVGASLLSVTAINVIRSGSLPNTDFRNPSAVLAALNNAFLMERQNNMYFTLWYGVYHSPSRTLRHASGGHPPALLLQTRQTGPAASSRLRSPGLIIGGLQDSVYTTETTSIPPGAQLFLLCDGCYEIKRPDGNIMRFDEFEQFMQLNGTQPDGLQQLVAWVKNQSGDAPMDDDFSIVRVCF